MTVYGFICNIWCVNLSYFGHFEGHLQCQKKKIIVKKTLSNESPSNSEQDEEKTRR